MRFFGCHPSLSYLGMTTAQPRLDNEDFRPESLGRSQVKCKKIF
jgi:hypothetical protein